LADANGNITAYINEQGIVVASYAYDAFGDTVAQSGSMSDIFAHRFSTKYYDRETGLYYYGMRFYSPVLHRWLNRDPIEEDGGLNLYAFCGNDGVNRWDVLGRLSLLWRNPRSEEWLLIDKNANAIAESARGFIANIEEILGFNVPTLTDGSDDALLKYQFGKDLSSLNGNLKMLFDLENRKWPHDRIDTMLSVRNKLNAITKIAAFRNWKVSKCSTIGLLGLTNHGSGTIGLNKDLFDPSAKNLYGLRNIMAHEASHLFALTLDKFVSVYSPWFAPNYGDLLEFDYVR
jgi:RHS repeat-associated protein